MSSSSLPDHYKVLGVAKDAQEKDIRTAYRKLVLKCHPDKVQDPTLKAQKQEEFQKVQQAYELLTDEEERKKYDDQVRLAELREQLRKTAVSSPPRSASRSASKTRFSTFEVRTADPHRASSYKASPGVPPQPQDHTRTRDPMRTIWATAIVYIALRAQGEATLPTWTAAQSETARGNENENGKEIENEKGNEREIVIVSEKEIENENESVSANVSATRRAKSASAERRPKKRRLFAAPRGMPKTLAERRKPRRRRTTRRNTQSWRLPSMTTATILFPPSPNPTRRSRVKSTMTSSEIEIDPLTATPFP